MLVSCCLNHNSVFFPLYTRIMFLYWDYFQLEVSVIHSMSDSFFLTAPILPHTHLKTKSNLVWIWKESTHLFYDFIPLLLCREVLNSFKNSSTSLSASFNLSSQSDLMAINLLLLCILEYIAWILETVFLSFSSSFLRLQIFPISWKIWEPKFSIIVCTGPWMIDSAISS